MIWVANTLQANPAKTQPEKNHPLYPVPEPAEGPTFNAPKFLLWFLRLSKGRHF